MDFLNFSYFYSCLCPEALASLGVRFLQDSIFSLPALHLGSAFQWTAV